MDSSPLRSPGISIPPEIANRSGIKSAAAYQGRELLKCDVGLFLLHSTLGSTISDSTPPGNLSGNCLLACRQL